jgi:peptide/nickel transport system permease protein
VQIPYALLPGRYELSLSAGAAMEVVSAEVLLRSATAGESSSVQVKFEPRRGSRAKIVFEVPAQWRAEAIVIGALGPDGRAGRGGVGLNGAGQSWSGSLRRVQANPLDSQFARHLGRLLCGDLGESTEYQLPVMQVLREGIGVSLSLTVPILVLGTVLALLLGLICAARRGGWFDRATLGITTGLMSINYVIWVVAGQYLLAYRWRLFPLWGYESWTYLALPVLIGVVSGLAHDVRFYRTVLLDEAGRPHVRTALAKGLGVARVLWRHVLRNSMVPVVTNISLAIPFLFTGSILLESFFGLPGLGGIGLNAVHSSDVAMVRAVVLVGAVLYQMANLLADLAYAWLDPRVRMR